MSTKPYDQAFKYLAEQDAESLLLLLGDLQPGQKATIELLPRELSVATRLPDQPYQVVTERGAHIAHVEAQTVYDSHIPTRMAEYGARLWIKYQLPISSYVLLLTQRGLPKRAPSVGRLDAGDVQITARYLLVRLWQVPAERMLALQRESLLPFVPLMHGGKAELEVGAQRLVTVADERRRREMSLHFLVLGGLRYNPEDLLDLIGRGMMIPWEQFKESSFYQFLAKEAAREAAEAAKEAAAKAAKKAAAKAAKEATAKAKEAAAKAKKAAAKAAKETAAKERIATTIKLLRLLAAKRFPGVQLGDEVESISDLAALQQLCVDLDDLPDAGALRQRLAGLTRGDKP